MISDSFDVVFNYVFTEYLKKSKKVKIADPVTHQDLLEVRRSGTADQFRSAMHGHLKPYYLKSFPGQPV